MRGFFSGIIWGLVLAVIGVAALSVLSPLAPPPEVAKNEPKPLVTEAPTVEAPAVESAPVEPKIVEAAPVVPESTAPEPGDLAEVDTTDTVPAAKPQVEEVAQKLETPTEAPADTELKPVQVEDNPKLPTEIGQSLETPGEEVNVSAETGAPAKPDAPTVDIAAQGLPKLEAPVGAPPAIVVNPDVPPAKNSAPVAVAGNPVADLAPKASTAPAPLPVAKVEPAPATAEPVAEEVQTAPIVTAELPKPEENTLPAVSQAPSADRPVVELPNPDPKAEPAPKIAALPQAGGDAGQTGPTIGKRVVPLTERGTVAQPKPSAQAVQVDPNLPPLQRYATVFDNAEDKPLMSIVLIDDEDAIGVEALADFPYPLAFAIDPTAADAAEKMARHRAAGFEVLALIDLPAAATAQDAEVSLSASFDTLDEAVGVLEGTGTGLQGNRDLSGQVSAFVQTTGRGMVVQDSGLNTVLKLAVRDGVPAAVVFRDFDGSGQDPIVMRRFLDKAVFRASQDGGVIMMGRVRPDTISALLLWGLQDRASRVALAPVSAVLSRSVAAQ